MKSPRRASRGIAIATWVGCFGWNIPHKIFDLVHKMNVTALSSSSFPFVHQFFDAQTICIQCCQARVIQVSLSSESLWTAALKASSSRGITLLGGTNPSSPPFLSHDAMSAGVISCMAVDWKNSFILNIPNWMLRITVLHVLNKAYPKSLLP